MFFHLEVVQLALTTLQSMFFHLAVVQLILTALQLMVFHLTVVHLALTSLQSMVFDLALIQLVLTALQSIVFLFLREHQWESPNTNLIFQRSQHPFQHIEVEIQFHTLSRDLISDCYRLRNRWTKFNILDEAVCISLRANDPGKCINPSILASAVSK